MTHRRLATFALAASLVLLAGLLVRARLARSDQPPPAAPPSEALAMQRLSHEGLLRRASSFVEEHAAQVDRFVVYVPESGGSGVRWRPDSVLFASPDRLVGVLPVPAADSAGPAVRVSTDSVSSDWVVVVGKDRRGALLSLSGTLGGLARSRCDSRPVDELMLNVPLSEHLAGAGVFDIGGALVGMVLRCGHRLAAIPARQISAFLAGPDSTDAPHERFGMSVAALDSTARAYFRADSGALVTAVRTGSPAGRAGIRPGDVLLAIDGAPVSSATQIAADSTLPDSGRRVERLRGRERSVVRLMPPTAASTTTLGIDLAPPSETNGVAITRVDSGSIARAAGLRAGDRITRIGSTAVATRAAAERLLGAARAAPVFITFERDSVERGVLVRP